MRQIKGDFMELPLITIIVPVYNTEQFLDKCISSIINQTYKNLEILLIDDGSIDRSGSICDFYKQKDARIQVYHLEHRGVSAARNKGLEILTGDFLCFVDSDDALEIDALEILLNEIEGIKADVVFFNSRITTEEHSFIRCENPVTGVVDQTELLRQMIGYCNSESMFSGYFFTCHCKFYRVKSLQKIDQNICRFDEAVRILEDGLWLMEHIPYLEKGILDNRPFYCRTIHTSSAMGNDDRWLDTATEYLSSFYKILLKFIKIGNQELIQAAKTSYYNSAVSYIRKAVSREDREAVFKIITALEPPYRDMFLANELYRLYMISDSRSFRMGRKITIACDKYRCIRWVFYGARTGYHFLKKIKLLITNTVNGKGIKCNVK